MTDNHPITPPPELVEQWRNLPEYVSQLRTMSTVTITTEKLQHIATQAARWGADQELEACLLRVGDGRRENLSQVIALERHRRPKPLSLKEQALARTDAILNDPNRALLIEVRETLELNRRALEALPE